MSNQPQQPTTSLLNPFHLLGGLLSDTIELAKFVGEEVADIPSALADGFNEGAIITPDNSYAAQVEAIKAKQQPANADTAIDAAIIKDAEEELSETEILLARIAELEAATKA